VTTFEAKESGTPAVYWLIRMGIYLLRQNMSTHWSRRGCSPKRSSAYEQHRHRPRLQFTSRPYEPYVFTVEHRSTTISRIAYNNTVHVTTRLTRSSPTMDTTRRCASNYQRKAPSWQIRGSEIADERPRNISKRSADEQPSNISERSAGERPSNIKEVDRCTAE